MTMFKVLALSMVAAYVCSGCGNIFSKDYDFTKPIVHLGSVVIKAKLIGKSKFYGDVYDGLSIRRSPYKLIFWFDSPDEKNRDSCLVLLDSMTLKNSESGEFVLFPENSQLVFPKSPNAKSLASFHYRYLDLLYADHELKFEYSLSQDCSLEQKQLLLV